MLLKKIVNFLKTSLNVLFLRLMKVFFHKSIATLMACVVLFTTMSFTVDMHFCGDTLVDISIAHKASSCEMDMVAAPADCDELADQEKSCCNDQQVVKQGQDDLKIAFDALSLDQQLFVTSFTYAYLSVLERSQSSEPSVIEYSSPFIKQDVQVLHQSFLI